VNERETKGVEPVRLMFLCNLDYVILYPIRLTFDLQRLQYVY